MIRRLVIIAAVVIGVLVLWKLIAILITIGGGLLLLALVSGGGGDSVQTPVQPQPQQFPANWDYAERQRIMSQVYARGGYFQAPSGNGSNGIATQPTFPQGSQWSSGIRTHPSTGLQNGTDIHYGGRYEGTYSNQGVYTYDPDGRTVLGQ